jgi:hypothetical protein
MNLHEKHMPKFTRQYGLVKVKLNALQSAEVNPTKQQISVWQTDGCDVAGKMHFKPVN